MLLKSFIELKINYGIKKKKKKNPPENTYI